MIREIPLPTIIAEASHLQGDFIFKNTGIVRGTIEGNLFNESKEVLRIAKEAWVNGSITSLGPVIVEGKVEGTIKSESRIELTSQANVFGLLIAPKLIILPGASLEGDCKMTQPKAMPLMRLAA